MNYKVYFAKESDLVKFVRVNGEYRFTPNMCNHKDLVKEGEVATSAGFVAYFNKKLKLLSQYSSSLKYLGPEDEDGPNIAKLVDMEYIGREW